jgi:hypothetical protein
VLLRLIWELINQDENDHSQSTWSPSQKIQVFEADAHFALNFSQLKNGSQPSEHSVLILLRWTAPIVEAAIGNPAIANAIER